MKTKNLQTTLAWLIAFSIAMAFLESSIVIYLRELLYPDGFKFPLVTMSTKLMGVELLREAATIIMLVAVGKFLGKNFTVSLAWFLISFAIWDIFYYVFLFAVLQWPDSLLTWDILFLIPIPWYGPVIAPVIISLLMIALGGVVLYYQDKGEFIRIKQKEALIMIAGCVVVLYSFTEEFIHYSLTIPENLQFSEKIIYKSQNFVPSLFHWPLYLLGVFIIISGVLLYYFRIKRTNAVFF